MGIYFDSQFLPLFRNADHNPQVVLEPPIGFLLPVREEFWEEVVTVHSWHLPDSLFSEVDLSGNDCQMDIEQNPNEF